MHRTAETTKVGVPPVVFAFKPHFVDALIQNVQTFFALTAADKFSDAGDEKVHCGNGFAVVVQAHIKRLDFFRITGEEHGFFEDMFGKVSFVFRLQIATPIYGEFKLVLVGKQKFDGFRISQTFKIAAHNVFKAGDKPRIDKLIKECNFFLATVHNVPDDVFDHCFRHIHIVVQVGKRHFGLDHPELRRVTRRVGLFGAESGPESINAAVCHCESFDVELSRYRKAGFLAEEVLGIIDLALFVLFDVVKIQRGHLEHCARAFAVAARDKRRVNVNEILFVEKFMDRKRDFAADAEDGVERVRTGTKIRLFP